LYPCSTLKGTRTGKENGNAASAMKNLNNSNFLSLIKSRRRRRKQKERGKKKEKII
jgi:hypothetical protein